MKKIKQFLVLIIALLILIIIFQNLQYVETRILFFTLVLPRSVLLLFMVLIGYAMGIVTSFFLRKRKQKSELPPSKENQVDQ